MNIVVVGDSLACPRRDGPGYEEIWPTRVGAALRRSGASAELVNRSARGRVLPDVLADFGNIVGYWDPGIVIFQVGIVDCAPRVFGRKAKAFLALPGIRRCLAPICVRIAGRYRRQIVSARPLVRYTRPAEFRRAVESLPGLLKGTERVLVIPILGTVPEREERSPGYNESVRDYNATWRSVAFLSGWTWLADLERDVESVREWLLPDGHHLTAKGHEAVARGVLSSLGIRTPETWERLRA